MIESAITEAMPSTEARRHAERRVPAGAEEEKSGVTAKSNVPLPGRSKPDTRRFPCPQCVSTSDRDALKNSQWSFAWRRVGAACDVPPRRGYCCGKKRSAAGGPRVRRSRLRRQPLTRDRNFGDGEGASVVAPPIDAPTSARGGAARSSARISSVGASR